MFAEHWVDFGLLVWYQKFIEECYIALKTFDSTGDLLNCPEDELQRGQWENWSKWT